MNTVTCTVTKVLTAPKLSTNGEYYKVLVEAVTHGVTHEHLLLFKDLKELQEKVKIDYEFES